MNTSIRQYRVAGVSRRWLAVAAVVGSLSVLAGCAHQSASSSVYSYGQAQREQIVRLGTVEAVRQVVIQNERSSGAGALAGGALGGVAGSAIGGGRGQVLAAIGGACLAHWPAMPLSIAQARSRAWKSPFASTMEKRESSLRKPTSRWV